MSSSSDVPKFGSFKPHPLVVDRSGGSNRPDAVTSNTDEDNGNEERSKKRTHTRHRHSHDDKRRRHQSPAPNDSFRLSASWKRLPDIDDVGDVFFVDRRGDYDNIRYGESAKSKRTAYHIPSTRLLLGSHDPKRGIGVDRKLLSSPDGLSLKLIHQDGKYVGSKPNPQASFSDQPLRLDDLSKDFLSFHQDNSSERTTKRRDLFLDHDSFHASTSEHSSSDSGEGHLGDEEQRPTDIPFPSTAALGRHNEELRQRVNEDPSCAESWLKYIQYQGERWNTNEVGHDLSTVKAHHRSIAEVKMSIYEDAIKRSAQPLAPLLLGLMKEAQYVYDNAKLAAKWRDMIQRYPDCPNLEQAFIEFLQTDFVQFDADTYRAEYAKYFQSLAEMPPTPKKPQLQIGALVRLTCSLRDLGFAELAIGIWQGTLELGLLTQSKFNNTIPSAHELSELFSDFEAFWDSESSRIGENGANGWQSKQLEAYEANHHVVDERVEEKCISATDAATRWFFEEQNAAAASLCPGNGTDDEDDDPFRVVLFTDIRPFLIYFPPEVKHDLINAFLQFVGLPAMPVTGLNARQAAFEDDQYKRHLPYEFDKSAQQEVDEHGHTSETMLSPVRMPCFMQTSDQLYPCGQGYLSPERPGIHIPDDWNLPARISIFVGRVLNQVVKTCPEDAIISEYYLAWQARRSPSQNDKNYFKSCAKIILKEVPTNLHVYNAFALGDMYLGKLKSAGRTLAATIDLAEKLPTAEKTAALHVLCSWIWCAMLEGDEKLALGRLLQIREEKLKLTEEAPQLEATQLSGIQDVDAAEARLLDLRLMWSTRLDVEIVSVVSELLGLLHYTKDSGAIDEAVASFSESVQLISPFQGANSPAVERVFQAQVRLIQHHIFHRRKAFSPSRLLASLNDGLARFPNNTLLLSLHSFLDRRTGFDSRIRRFTEKSLKTAGAPPVEETSFVVHSFLIDREMDQAASRSSLGSTSHSVRAAFERAVASRSAAHSLDIWRRWVLYEASLANAQQYLPSALSGPSSSLSSKRSREAIPASKRVKDIFQRGWKNLPWCKQFAMLPFSPPLRSYFSDQELEEIYAMMQEKGLRIHRELNGKRV